MPDLPATTIGSNSYREMFSGCSSITDDVNLDHLTSAGSDSFVSMLKYTGITSLSMKGITTLGGGGINTLCSSCPNLVSVDIRNLERINGSYGMGEVF